MSGRKVQLGAAYTTLISAPDLAAQIWRPDWLVLDCRAELSDRSAGERLYHKGHLPGARFAPLVPALAGGPIDEHGRFRGRHPLPDRENFVAAVRSWGVSNWTQVVAYDAHDSVFAARLWWMLRWLGHEAVAVLDGGLAAWTAHSLSLSRAPVSAAPGSFMPRLSLVPMVEAGDVLATLEARTHSLIDARPADRFRGENEVLDPVGGHIPGANNRCFKDNLQADGRFKPADQLHAEIAPLIETPEQTIVYCGSGAAACQQLLAMELAQLPGAALYPGSWSEWCADRGRPVETGLSREHALPTSVGGID